MSNTRRSRRGLRRVIALALAGCSLAAVGGTTLATAEMKAPSANLDKSTLDLFAASCDGQDVQTLSTPFVTFWIGDQKYVFITATVTDNGEVVFAKDWGARTGLGERIHCEGDFEEGTHFDLIAAAVPPDSQP